MGQIKGLSNIRFFLSSLMAILITFVVIASCSGRGQKINDESAFSEAMHMRIPESSAFIADSVFEVEVPLQNETPIQLVYVIDPTCSFCIGKGLSCYRSYLGSMIDVPFVFLGKKEDDSLFRVYIRKESFSKSPRMVFSEIQSDLPDGLYTVVEGHVSAYCDWNI